MAKAKYQETATPQQKKRYGRFLAEDEELVLVTGFSPIFLRQQFIIYIMLPGAIFWVIALIFAYFKHLDLGYALIVGLVLSIIFAFLKTKHLDEANKYILTTRRLIVKRGYLTVKLITALFDKITHIEVEQGLIDRMFLFHGTIRIHTAGADRDEIVLKNVEAPVQFKNVLERLINREREQYNRSASPVVSVEGELVE